MKSIMIKPITSDLHSLSKFVQAYGKYNIYGNDYTPLLDVFTEQRLNTLLRILPKDEVVWLSRICSGIIDKIGTDVQSVVKLLENLEDFRPYTMLRFSEWLLENKLISSTQDTYIHQAIELICNKQLSAKNLYDIIKDDLGFYGWLNKLNNLGGLECVEITIDNMTLPVQLNLAYFHVLLIKKDYDKAFNHLIEKGFIKC